MNKISERLMLPMLLWLSYSVQTHAESLQSIDAIEHSAYVFALAEAQAQYNNPQVVLEPLDSRLRLQQCDNALDTFSNSQNNGLGNQTIGVKCTSPVAWTVYVPVKVKLYKPVVVAAKPITTNQVITHADLRFEQHDIATIRQGYIDSMDRVVGQQLKYPVAVGNPIKPNSLIERKIVFRGEKITLVATVGAMEVRMAGTAMEDATQGERISVKNVSSQRVIEGVADAPGIVRVRM